MSEAFVTGSNAYSEPKEDSDLDLVIMCDLETVELLRKYADAQDEIEDYKYDDVMQVRFGKLNIIMCVDNKTFNTWKHGTKILKSISPVSRDYAVD